MAFGIEVLVNGNRCIVLEDAVKVESHTTKKWFHTVRPGHCTCIGFYYRNACRHQGEADQAIRNAIRVVRERNDLCQGCGELRRLDGSDYCVRCLRVIAEKSA